MGNSTQYSVMTNMGKVTKKAWIYVCVCVHAKLLQSCLILWTPQTVARQDPLSMGFSQQEHWSGLPFPSPGDLPVPGIKPMSLVSPVLYH